MADVVGLLYEDELRNERIENARLRAEIERLRADIANMKRDLDAAEGNPQ